MPDVRSAARARKTDAIAELIGCNRSGCARDVALVVLALGLLARSRTGDGRAKVPMSWFVLGFVALITINSLFPVPAAIKSPVGIMTAFGLSVALAAMGLETDVRKLPAKGPRPFLLGLIAFFFISGSAVDQDDLMAGDDPRAAAHLHCGRRIRAYDPCCR
jgi:Conserved hypothetical protein 698